MFEQSNGRPARQALWKRILKWLYPGLGIKRWLLLVFIGLTIACLGASIAIEGHKSALFWGVARWLDRVYPPLFLHPYRTGAAVVLLGILLLALGIRQTVRSISAVLIPRDRELVDVIFEKRHLEHGPRVAAIGGGTGLSSLLRGLKAKTSNITAVVTVADDGGSSGRLRESGMLPPGDIRNCLAALADVEPLMTQLFQYRFQGLGEGLDGHSFGNLFIAAMTNVTGDFVTGVKETSKVLAIRGEVLPATLTDVKLAAKLTDGNEVHGQVAVNQAPAPIAEAYLEPANPPGLREAVDAILQADVIVFGPGSLFSSIIPNLLVPDIARAVRETRALKIYICNVMTQPNETLNYTASDHVRELLKYIGGPALDYVLINTQRPSRPSLERYEHKGSRFVLPDIEAIEALGPRVVTGDWVSEESYVRHDSRKLADCIFRLVEEAHA